MLALKEQEKQLISINNNTVNEYYEAFLSKYTSGTSKAYKTACNLFSNFMYGKDMKFLTFSELKNIKMLNVMKYHGWLSEKYKINTVNKHINGVKSFFNFLNKEFDDISDKVFRNIDLESPKKDIEGWGGIEWDEAKALWEHARMSLGEVSDKMSMLIKLACVTSIRGEALTTATWSKNWKTTVENGMTINYIDVVDKGQRHIKPVSDTFYNQLRECLPEDKMFSGLNKNNINDYLKKCLDDLGFDESRNIKFHSLKKAGVMRALDMTDNIYKAQEQGNHKSIKTTEEHYLQYKHSLMDMTSYSMDESIDISIELTNYSKEELLDAISKMREVSKKELLKILNG